MDIEYSVNIGDLKAYLATKQDDEPVGVPGKGYACLAARTLQWKYPNALMVGVHTGNMTAELNGQVIDMDDDVTWYADTFDEINDNFESVTKAELRVLMPELFA